MGKSRLASQSILSAQLTPVMLVGDSTYVLNDCGK